MNKIKLLLYDEFIAGLSSLDWAALSAMVWFSVVAPESLSLAGIFTAIAVFYFVHGRVSYYLFNVVSLIFLWPKQVLFGQPVVAGLLNISIVSSVCGAALWIYLGYAKDVDGGQTRVSIRPYGGWVGYVVISALSALSLVVAWFVIPECVDMICCALIMAAYVLSIDGNKWHWALRSVIAVRTLLESFASGSCSLFLQSIFIWLVCLYGFTIWHRDSHDKCLALADILNSSKYYTLQ